MQRRLRRPWRVLLAVLLVAGCAGRAPPDHPETRQQIVAAALGQLGRPYVFGGRTPDGFDCSGLVQYAYSEAGVIAPRDTRSQREAGTRVAFDDAQPGDLLFYRFEDSGGLHVGLYLGDGRMIHAPSSGRQVSLTSVESPVWRKRFLGTVKLLR